MVGFETEEEALKHTIYLVEHFEPQDHPGGIDAAFAWLTTFNQQDNQRLWNDLRQALRENEALTQPHIIDFLSHPEYAARTGYWWYDAANWKVD